MPLEDLESAVAEAKRDLDDVDALDGEARTELALLVAALDTDDADELVRRGVHALFQRTVETGTLDFHLRANFDVTYDEYLSGMTYDEMTGADQAPRTEDGRDRYTF